MSSRPLSAFERMRQVAEEKQRQRAQLVPNYSPVLATDDASVHTVLATATPGGAANSNRNSSDAESTNNSDRPQPAELATPVASNSTPLAITPDQLATVASLLPNAAANTHSLLARPVASNPRAGKKPKVFTPPHKAQLNVRIDKSLKAKLDMIVAAEGSTMNDLVEKAVRQLLATPVASLLATYDSDDDLNDDIIKLFTRITGKRVTEADLKDYRSVKHLDPNVIKVGMLMTVLNFKGQRINSFKYMLPEIEKATLSVPQIQSPGEYVKYLISKVKRELGTR